MSQARSSLAVLACGLFWTLLGAAVGALFRHPWFGLVVGGLFGLAYCVLGAYAAEKFPLDVWDARLLMQDQAPNLYEMLAELGAKTDLPLPTLYTYPGPEASAFALAGRDGNTAVAVSYSLTRRLDKDEVQAALALLTARLATGRMPGWTVTATLAGMPLFLGARLSRSLSTAWLGRGVLAAWTPLASALLALGCDPAVVLASDVHARHLCDSPAAFPAALARMEASWADATSGPLGLGTGRLFAAPPPPARPDAAARLAQADAADRAIQDLG